MTDFEEASEAAAEETKRGNRRIIILHSLKKGVRGRFSHLSLSPIGCQFLEHQSAFVLSASTVIGLLRSTSCDNSLDKQISNNAG